MSNQWDARFCQAYLRTMDPERAAAEAGRENGYALLATKTAQSRLEKMRSAAGAQLRREDVLRRLAQLAFGRANDAVYLALRGKEADPQGLELSAVTEFRVTDRGVEVKLADRVRALEALGRMLSDGGGSGAQDLYQALAEAAEEGEWDHG